MFMSMYLHLLALDHARSVEQILVDRNAAHVIKVGLGYPYAVNLRFENFYHHGRGLFNTYIVYQTDIARLHRYAALYAVAVAPRSDLLHREGVDRPEIYDFQQSVALHLARYQLGQLRGSHLRRACGALRYDGIDARRGLAMLRVQKGVARRERQTVVASHDGALHDLDAERQLFHHSPL